MKGIHIIFLWLVITFCLVVSWILLYSIDTIVYHEEYYPVIIQFLTLIIWLGSTIIIFKKSEE